MIAMQHADIMLKAQAISLFILNLLDSSYG